jgi:hypothetical protein
MKLSAENVDAVVKDCLYRDEEITPGKTPEGVVIVEGIMTKFGFHPGRLAAHKEDIREMLSELPDQFFVGKGGGWSFLNACMTKEGEQWGEHRDMDALFSLGIGVGFVRNQLPRDMWAVLPGCMPYFSVDLRGDAKEAV